MSEETDNNFGREVMQAADIWVKIATSQNAYTSADETRCLPGRARGVRPLLGRVRVSACAPE